MVREDIIGRILTPTSKVHNEVDWDNTSNSFIHFKNGSTIKSLSASATANIESEHFHLVVIDEAHRCVDFVIKEKFRQCYPYPLFKMIKIGISLYKNNLWHSLK